MIPTQQAIDHLRPYLTDNRWDLMHDILRQRTRFLTVITEELYREHNANALLRSCECFGLQEMHVVDNINEFAIHRDMSRGAAKWVDINKHKDIRQCIEGLKNRGYRIAAAHPEADYTPETLPLDRPLAIMLGTEWHGLSETAFELADTRVKIPMYGFTESLNVSVSCAVLLQQLNHRLRSQDPSLWQLTSEDFLETLLDWTKKSVKHSEPLLKALAKEEAS